jgi:hypothetical protein
MLPVALDSGAKMYRLLDVKYICLLRAAGVAAVASRGWPLSPPDDDQRNVDQLGAHSSPVPTQQPSSQPAHMTKKGEATDAIPYRCPRAGLGRLGVR